MNEKNAAAPADQALQLAFISVSAASASPGLTATVATAHGDVNVVSAPGHCRAPLFDLLPAVAVAPVGLFVLQLRSLYNGMNRFMPSLE